MVESDTEGGKLSSRSTFADGCLLDQSRVLSHVATIYHKGSLLGHRHIPVHRSKVAKL